MTGVAIIWAGFIALVLALLAFDLFVLNRKAHIIRTAEAVRWTIMWVCLSLLFCVGVYFLYEHHILGIGKSIGQDLGGRKAATLFLTGYLVEQSLSLDNLFVIATIFAYFRVPPQYQHRALFWGILGAIVMRGAMIILGAALIRRFEWIMYVFGGLLIISAVKMLVMRTDHIDIEKNIVVRMTRRIWRVSPDYDGEKFWTRIDGLRAMTPLMLALIVVEFADLVFAVDSIPAIFAITTDPFLVFSSNVFAILGLRSMYFALASALDKFKHLKASLAFVLAFVGVKMILARQGFHIDPVVSLSTIALALAMGVIASIADERIRASREAPLGDEVEQAARAMIKRARKIVIFVIGVTVLLIAIPVGLLPGPGGILVVILGLMILATEFVWARRWLRKTREKAEQMARYAQRQAGDAYHGAKRLLGFEHAAPPRPDVNGAHEPREDE